MRSKEDIYNVNAGVDYLGSIFTPQQSYDDARKSLSDAILASPDTTGIQQLTIDIGNGEFTFEAQVLTIYGQIPVTNQ